MYPLCSFEKTRGQNTQGKTILHRSNSIQLFENEKNMSVLATTALEMPSPVTKYHHSKPAQRTKNDFSIYVSWVITSNKKK